MRLVGALRRAERGEPSGGPLIGIRNGADLGVELAIFFGLRKHLTPRVLFVDADTWDAPGRHLQSVANALPRSLDASVQSFLDSLDVRTDMGVDYLGGLDLQGASWNEIVPLVSSFYPLTFFILPHHSSELDKLTTHLLDFQAGTLTHGDEVSLLPDMSPEAARQFTASGDLSAPQHHPATDAYLADLAGACLGHYVSAFVEPHVSTTTDSPLVDALLRASLHPAHGDEGRALENYLHARLPGAASSEILLTLLGDVKNATPSQLVELVQSAARL